MARPMAGIGRFVGGAVLGFMGLLAVAVAILALSSGWDAVDRRLNPDASLQAKSLTVDGRDASRIGGEVLTIAGAGLDLRLGRRGVCDDLTVVPANPGAKVQLLDGEGRCVACGQDARWQAKPDGSAALALQRRGGGR